MMRRSRESVWTLIASFCWTFLLHRGSVSALSTALSQSSCINVHERAPRNIRDGETWAKDQGVEVCPGFRLVMDPIDEQDWSISTTKALKQHETILQVPPHLFLTSEPMDTTQSASAEQCLVDILQDPASSVNAGEEDLIPLFRLVIQLLQQYELGQESFYYPWLDALPRRFYNGVVMTSACFECLPPFVRYLSEKERDTCQAFVQALVQQEQEQQSSSTLLSSETIANTDLIQWAYCVALTRSWPIPLNNNDESTSSNSMRIMAPLADFFNHDSSYHHEAEYYIDDQGNFVVYTTRDIPPNTNLRLCYSDPTNPSKLLAQYGFLDKSSPASFCKLLHLQHEMADLQMDYSQLLFFKDTGEISAQVWDLMLYSILLQTMETDPDPVNTFYNAYYAQDEETKQALHAQYYSYTWQALLTHVQGTLEELDYLAQLAKTKDIAKHPRLSLIQQHNNYVQETFLKVQEGLEAMMPEAS